jgi:hypothetical protein
MRTITAWESHEQFFLEDELLSGVVGCSVDARVHSDRIHGTRLDAEAAKNAAQLVNHEALWEALVAASWIPFWVLTGFDVNALRRTRRGAAQASNATRRAVFALREAVYAAEARGVRALLLRIRDAVDAVFDGLRYRIIALAEHHFFRVLKEVLHRDPEAFGDLGDVGLDGRRALGARNRDTSDLLGTEGSDFVLHADSRALRVPPAAAAYCAEDEDKVLRLWTGFTKNTTNQMNPPRPAKAMNARL